MRSQQMPLGLAHPAHYGRDAFVEGASNAEALAIILNSADPVLMLSGPDGSGKTHLAHIWAERRAAIFVSPADLAAGDLGRHLATGAAVVEDIDRPNLPETALFHLLNTCREAGARLLLTARRPAANLYISLPDLASRLRLARPARLLAPDELLLRPVLVKLFADRQLIVDKAVLDYLLPRIERSFAGVTEIVERLDAEALSEGRAITRPMAARLLAEHSSAQQGFMDFG